MNLHLAFYVPRGLADGGDIKEIDDLLDEIKTSLKIKVRKEIIDDKGEEELKDQTLFVLAVRNRIKIKQTIKTKRLYPQLVVVYENRAVTFYPQSRPGNKITIQDFLKGLLKKEVKCLHEKYEIEDAIKG
ncbi:MAG: hypothetical protein ABIH76_08320 [Candidatus Bathyarchaeota archaeon]